MMGNKVSDGMFRSFASDWNIADNRVPERMSRAITAIVWNERNARAVIGVF